MYFFANFNIPKYLFFFKGVSAFAALNNFDVIKGFPTDYMHNILLGVTKKMIKLWLFDCGKPYHISKNLLEILNKRILSIKPITDIKRRPRSLNDVAHFKANEYRSMLLYYLPICLSGILPMKYLKNFRLLSNSIYRLLQTKIPECQLEEIEIDLNQFVDGFQLLYGEKNMTLNVHLLKHTVYNVRMHGPLWTHSTFHFESYNGILLGFVSGNTKILHQISTKYIVYNLLRKRRTKKITKKTEEINFLGKFNALHEKKLVIQIFESGKIIHLENFELNICKRMKNKSTIFTSKCYTRPKKSIDYFVCCKDGITFGMVEYYLMHEGKKYAVLDQFEKIAPTNDYLTAFIQIKPKNMKLLVGAELIEKKCIYFSFKKSIFAYNHFIVSPPNNIEKD